MVKALAIDMTPFRAIVEEAREAFRVDPTYAVSMCRQGKNIQNKRAAYAARKAQAELPKAS